MLRRLPCAGKSIVDCSEHIDFPVATCMHLINIPSHLLALFQFCHLELQRETEMLASFLFDVILYDPC